MLPVEKIFGCDAPCECYWKRGVSHPFGISRLCFSGVSYPFPCFSPLLIKQHGLSKQVIVSTRGSVSSSFPKMPLPRSFSEREWSIESFSLVPAVAKLGVSHPRHGVSHPQSKFQPWSIASFRGVSHPDFEEWLRYSMFFDLESPRHAESVCSFRVMEYCSFL